MAPNEIEYPTVDGLLREQQFYRGQIAEDIQEFSRQVENAVKERSITLPSNILGLLTDLRTRQSTEAIRTLTTYFIEAQSGGYDLLQFYRRGHYYLACGGDPSAAQYVASEAANLALDDIRLNADLSMVSVAMSWIMTANELGGASVIDHIPTVEAWVTPLRRSILGTFHKVLTPANGVTPALKSADTSSFTDLNEASSRILKNIQEGGNVLSFPTGSLNVQTRINLTVADLVALLEAIATPEILSAALAAAGIHTTLR